MQVEKINNTCWEIPKTGAMQVPARIYATSSLLNKIKQDNTLKQAVHVAQLKGILKHALVMPDAHEGYGFPIGGVAAFDAAEGIISPGGIGYDVNCGVRLIRTPYTISELMKKRTELLEKLFEEVPSGVGRAGSTSLSHDELLEILDKGSLWSVKNGYGTRADVQATEEQGRMAGADPLLISPRALARGKPQLGTLGAGNHFLEIQQVGDIYDEKTAKAFGIADQGQVVVMVHCGSRGLGHQIASDYIRKMEEKYGYSHLPDRELVNAPLQSELGQEYYQAMQAGVNYAFANRQMIIHWIRHAFEQVMGSADGMEQVYDVCHNIAKMEKHDVDGETREVCIHRKGATRAFGPGREEVPEQYRAVGQPIFIPGSMGTASYVLAGTKTAEAVSFGSTAHGAGRELSRKAALNKFRGEDVAKALQGKGIAVRSMSYKGIAEEAPGAYKDIDEVVSTSHDAGIGKRVVRLLPVGVVKG